MWYTGVTQVSEGLAYGYDGFCVGIDGRYLIFGHGCHAFVDDFEENGMLTVGLEPRKNSHLINFWPVELRGIMNCCVLQVTCWRRSMSGMHQGILISS